MRAQRLTVAMNGEVVGTLHRDGSGAMSFQYAPEWLAEPGARAISLSLPLQHGRIRGKQVFNFFSNLLPDSEAIIARMQAVFRLRRHIPLICSPVSDETAWVPFSSIHRGWRSRR